MRVRNKVGLGLAHLRAPRVGHGVGRRAAAAAAAAHADVRQVGVARIVRAEPVAVRVRLRLRLRLSVRLRR